MRNTSWKLCCSRRMLDLKRLRMSSSLPRFVHGLPSCANNCYDCVQDELSSERSEARSLGSSTQQQDKRITQLNLQVTSLTVQVTEKDKALAQASQLVASATEAKVSNTCCVSSSDFCMTAGESGSRAEADAGAPGGVRAQVQGVHERGQQGQPDHSGAPESAQHCQGQAENQGPTTVIVVTLTCGRS